MAVFIVCMFAAVLVPGLVWPWLHGRRIRARGFDPEVYPHKPPRTDHP